MRTLLSLRLPVTAPLRISAKLTAARRLTLLHFGRDTSRLEFICTPARTTFSMSAKGRSRSASSESRSKTPLVKRSVVSSFLYRFTREDGELKAKVALFKRSGQVRTYP